MAKELTGLGKFTIWVLVPALVGALGYYKIGPNVGGIGAKAPALRKIGQKIAKGVGKEPSAPEEDETATPNSATSNPARAPRAGATPSASGSGATEFQRIREAQPNRPAPRRSSIDRVDN